MERIIDPYQNPNEPTSIQSFFCVRKFLNRGIGWSDSLHAASGAIPAPGSFRGEPLSSRSVVEVWRGYKPIRRMSFRIMVKYSLPTKNLCLLIDAFVGPDRRQQFSSGNPMELTRILAPKHHFWGKRPSHDDEKEGESWDIQDVQCITQASRHAGKEVNIVWRGHGCVENACAAVMLPCLACTF